MKRLNYISIWALLLLALMASFIAYLIIYFGQVRAWTHQYNLGGSMAIVWLVLVLYREYRIKKRRIKNEFRNWNK